MKEIPLSRGLVAMVDDSDYERVVAASPWHACPRGRTVYGQRNVRRPDGRHTTEQLHSFITGWARVDHENGNGLDNQRANLRESTIGQNSHNRKRRVDSTSGFKGVFRNPSRGRPWRAQIALNYKKRHLGLFATAEEAAHAYDQAAIELFGAFAQLNFTGESNDSAA